MKLVCISDTHGFHEFLTLPDGDILLHAGDITTYGKMQEVVSFNYWLKKQMHPHKIVIAGNHDWCFDNEEREISKKALSNATYLFDSGTEVNGIKFWGTPWQPWFYDWAFNLRFEEDREKKWGLIPDDTDVLIVHGPPYKYGDLCSNGDNPGCKKLKERILETNIKVVVTGHIHESYGIHDMKGVQVVNASIMNLQYVPVNSPIVVEISTK